MIKNLSALEVKIGDRVYKLICEMESPLGEVHDVLCQMKHYVVQRLSEAHAAEQPKQESEEKAD